MGVRRAQHVSVSLAVQVVVALETAVAAQETLVLETPHRLSDSELAHYLTPSPWWQGTPCSSELLQSRDTDTRAILVLLSGAAVDAAGALEDAVTIGTTPSRRRVRWSARSAISPVARPNAAETTAFPGWHDGLLDLSALPLSRGTDGSNPSPSGGESGTNRRRRVRGRRTQNGSTARSFAQAVVRHPQGEGRA